MLKNATKVSLVLLILLVGVVSGLYLERGIFQTNPSGKFTGPIPDSLIKQENHKIDSFSRVAEVAKREVDSLKTALQLVRSEKKNILIESLKKDKTIKEINEELKANEKRYSVIDSSLIFSVDSVLTENPDGTVIVKREGLRVIQGILTENIYQTYEINKLDSIVRADSIIKQSKDSVINNILSREMKKENYYLDQNKKQQLYYQKKLRKRTIGIIGSAVLGVLIGKFLL